MEVSPEAPASPDTEDLIIKMSNVDLLNQHRQRIQSVFHVELSYGLTSQMDANQWVNIQGAPGDRRAAKDYIKALCTPVEKIVMSYPPETGAYLSDPKIHLKLERLSGAVIIFTDKDTMQVLGSDSLSVTLAMSAIEDIISNYDQGDGHCGEKSPSASMASKRLDQELRRLSSGRHQYDLHEELSFEEMNDAVKRTILHTLKDDSLVEQPEMESDANELEGRTHSETACKDNPSHPVAKERQPQLLPPDVFASPRKVQPSTDPPAHNNLTGFGLLDNFGAYSQDSAAKQPVATVNTGSTGLAPYGVLTTPSFPVLTAEDVSEIEKGYQSKASVPNQKAQPVKVTLEPPVLVAAKSSGATAKAVTLYSNTNEKKAAGARRRPSGERQGKQLVSDAVDRPGEAAAVVVLPSERQKEEHKDLLFASGIQENFTEKEMERIFKEKGADMTQERFIEILQSNRGALLKRQQGKGKGFPKAPSDEELQANPSLKPALHNTEYLGPYMDKLLKDHQKERADCSIDEMKANNFERQMILRDTMSKQKSSGSPQLGHSSESPIEVTDSVNDGEIIEVDFSDDEVQIMEEFRTVEKKRKHHTKGEPRKTRFSPAEEIGEKYEPKAVGYGHERAHQAPKVKQQPMTNQRQQQVLRAPRRSPSPRNIGPDYRGRSRSPQYGSQPATAQRYGQAGHSSYSHAVGMPANTSPLRTGLRYIVIDGSNVAMAHGNHEVFSCRGIEIAVNWFLNRGHTQVTAFVPQWRTRSVQNDHRPIHDQHLLEELRKKGYLNFTPARKIPGRGNIVCYDDRFVVDLANQTDGVILSNDNYRDLWEEKREWRNTIEESLLMFNFVGDILMIPDDPLGRDGPKLDDFLRAPYPQHSSRQASQQQHHHRPPRTYQQQLQQQQGNLTWQQQGLKPQSDEQPGGFLPGPSIPTPLLPLPNYPGQNQQQAKKPGRQNVNRAARQTMPQDSVANQRPRQKTSELRKQLGDIFDRTIVDRILQNHPAETDIEKLSSHILDAQST